MKLLRSKIFFTAELNAKLTELKAQLFNYASQHAINQLG